MEILNLSAEERDKIRSGLTDDQLEFIDYYVKRGKRTQFAREMACSKGIYITDSMSDDEIEDLIDDWVLIDYKDAGPNWRSDELRSLKPRNQVGQPPV